MQLMHPQCGQAMRTLHSLRSFRVLSAGWELLLDNGRRGLRAEGGPDR